jgi:uncharacterized protein (TIGR00369 family)
MSGGDDPLDVVPPAARLLGRRLVSADRQQGIVELEFHAGPELRNRRDLVQGGMQAAMLDSTVGCAAVSVLDGGSVATQTLNVSFLRPAALGALRGRGRIVHRGRSTIFAEGELRDASGEIVATATATLRILRTKSHPQ